jgi:hypothetical protein
MPWGLAWPLIEFGTSRSSGMRAPIGNWWRILRGHSGPGAIAVKSDPLIRQSASHTLSEILKDHPASRSVGSRARYLVRVLLRRNAGRLGFCQIWVELGISSTDRQPIMKTSDSNLRVRPGGSRASKTDNESKGPGQ